MAKAATNPVKRPVAMRKTYVLNRTKSRARAFSALNAKVVDTVAKLRRELEHPPKSALWISFDKALTDALLKNLPWRNAPFGKALFLHDLAPKSIPAVRNCFVHFAYSVEGRFLGPRELAEVLAAENQANLLIGGSVDEATQTITLWRGNLEALTVPFSAFPASGDGIRPDFRRFNVTEYGQTIELGTYEASAEAVLYEYDPEYRRRIKKERQASEQSFGASLRRLRKQRGLSREDFAPAVASKTVARIEQGQVNKIQPRTLKALADRLDVSPEELGFF